MTQQINDPCIQQTVPREEDPYTPSVPPGQPRTLRIPTEVFPTNQYEGFEQSTIRESILVEEELFYQDFKGEALRTGAETLFIQIWQEDLESVDVFRFVSGKMHHFEQNQVKLFHEGFDASLEKGVPFNIDLYDFQTNFQHVQSNRVKLTFRMNLLEQLLELNNINLNPEDYLLELINGKRLPSGAFNRSTGLLGGPTYSKVDTFFKAPAAFFAAEAENSSFPLVEVASFTPVTGDLTLEESSQPEHKLTSLYRLNTAMLREGSETPFEESYAQDTVQKFAGSAVAKINDITKEATNQNLHAQIFSRSEFIMNNHVRMMMNINHESEICRIFREARLDIVFLDILASDETRIEDEYAQVIDQSRLGGMANNKVVYDHKPRIYDGNRFINLIFQDIDRTIDALEERRLQHPIPYYRSSVRNSMFPRLEQNYWTGIPEMMVMGFIKDNKRNIKQILQGTPAFSEVVAYRVEKLGLGGVEPELLQEFYFFNDQNTSFIDFIDSQVSYKRDYEYKIYAINAVVGSKYTYSKPEELYTIEQAKESTPEYNFEVDCASSFYFIETPYYQQQITVLDKPPLFPNVEIKPFFQIAEKIGFMLTPTYGSVTEKPIRILQEDEEIINKMLLAHDPGNNLLVEYSGDSQPTEYEMLMIDFEPTRYSDFSSASRFSAEATYNSGYIEINLESNKKYYLIFRAIDGSGISNPSAVFALTVNSHADGIYVEFDEHDMTTEEAADVLTFERILKIDPSPEQMAINFQEHMQEEGFYLSAPPAAELSLGGHDDLEQLWSNEYRFRLISRTTGKAIDLNIEYGYKAFNSEIYISGDSIIFRPDFSNQEEIPRITETNILGAAAVSRVPSQNNQESETEYDENGLPISSTTRRDGSRSVTERMRQDAAEGDDSTEDSNTRTGQGTTNEDDQQFPEFPDLGDDY